ncbi:MAG: winged helix-turn-helix transcriptional regulator [Candidatus Heimdallarchaeota archaeon]|nr:winged helix-turn-helix transcriptional regulator [Candidatus Heimdallarchaeota archaeon]
MERNPLTEINEDDIIFKYHENESKEDFGLRIEEVLSSKGRILILKILAEMDELNISAIARVTNLNHNTTSQHLEYLTKVGLVQEKRFGRIKIFRFKSENIRARSLKKLFEVWE